MASKDGVIVGLIAIIITLMWIVELLFAYIGVKQVIQMVVHTIQ